MEATPERTPVREALLQKGSFLKYIIKTCNEVNQQKKHLVGLG